MPTLVTKVKGGKSAVYVKPTSGDPLAPFNDPGSHLEKVLFHSDLDLYRVHIGPTDVTLTLPSVPGGTRTFSANPNLNIIGIVQTDDVLLITHGLGIVPNYMIIWNNTELIDGDMVQFITGEGSRHLTHWADTNAIYLRSEGNSSSDALSAMTFNCKVVVFKQSTETSQDVFDFDTTTGRLVLGKGTFDSNEKLLRAQGQAGDTPYDIQIGQSIHIQNGRSRIARASGTVTDEADYNGSFVAPPGFEGVIN